MTSDEITKVAEAYDALQTAVGAMGDADIYAHSQEAMEETFNSAVDWRYSPTDDEWERIASEAERIAHERNEAER